MTVAIVYSRALAGVDAPLVTVEVHLANGLPAFNLVGLPETEVKASKDRVRAAVVYPARSLLEIAAAGRHSLLILCPSKSRFAPVS